MIDFFFISMKQCKPVSTVHSIPWERCIMRFWNLMTSPLVMFVYLHQPVNEKEGEQKLWLLL